MKLIKIISKNSLTTGNNVVKIGESGEKKIDVQQQLRYVAVSRATNTVSIISDNVKTEDSPLNYISEDEQFEEVVVDEQLNELINNYARLNKLQRKDLIWYSGIVEQKDLN